MSGTRPAAGVTDLFLIRHGESFANVQPIIGGMRGDAGLTERGHRQARLLAERIAGSGPRVDALYSSTLPRARQTTGYLAPVFGLEPIFDDEWQELRPGEADGLTIAEWEARFGRVAWGAGGDPYRLFAPGGESWGLFLARVGVALTRLLARHPGQRVGVVCHGGVLEASFFHAFGLGPTARVIRFDPMNTSLTHWRYHPVAPPGLPYWSLVTFNDAAHLTIEHVGDASRQAVPTPVSDPE